MGAFMVPHRLALDLSRACRWLHATHPEGTSVQHFFLLHGTTPASANIGRSLLIWQYRKNILAPILLMKLPTSTLGVQSVGSDSEMRFHG